MSDAAEVLPAWSRITRRLEKHAPGDHAALHPGASAAALTALEAGLGSPPHPALRALPAACDGVVPRRASDEAGAFLIGYSLLDTEKVLEWQRHLATRAEDAVEEGYEDEVGRTAHARWVPFAQALTGDLLFVDHREGGYGTVCELSFGDPDHRRPWPGLGVMLGDLAGAMEEETPLLAVGRRPAVHQGRMLEWPTV
ncbi:SMI1/KNR4 family protein [Streptomyces vietnamensis]|uniref:SMI1/KNR4 family protein n=1 Tax=Streptomyces vietnamensis TaxID=362257 RepID=UPI0034141417